MKLRTAFFLLVLATVLLVVSSRPRRLFRFRLRKSSSAGSVAPRGRRRKFWGRVKRVAGKVGNAALKFGKAAFNTYQQAYMQQPSPYAMGGRNPYLMGGNGYGNGYGNRYGNRYVNGYGNGYGYGDDTILDDYNEFDDDEKTTPLVAELELLTEIMKQQGDTGEMAEEDHEFAQSADDSQHP